MRVGQGGVRKCFPRPGIIPGDSLDRLEQEFLKEKVCFVRKTILLTLAPQRLQIRLHILLGPESGSWAGAWQGAAEADLEPDPGGTEAPEREVSLFGRNRLLPSEILALIDPGSRQGPCLTLGDTFACPH